MFTIQQIGQAIRKIKSFAEFPSLLDDFKSLGIVKYDNYNTDGRSVYYGKDNFTLEGAKKYNLIEISNTPDASALKTAIKRHQNEESSFFTFSKEMAAAGAKIYTVDTITKEIIYYGSDGFEMLRSKVG